MVVENKNIKLNLLIPAGLSILLLIIYTIFGAKYFGAALVLMIFGFLSIIDIRIAIFGVTFTMVFLPDTLALLSYLGVAFIYFVRRVFYKDEDIKMNIFFGIISLYLLVAIIQTVTSVNLMGSLRDLGLHIGGLCYVFVVVNSIKSKEDLNSLLTVLMVSATLVALYGVLQAFTGVEIRREWLDVENNPDVAVRVFSVFGNPNTLAEYLVLLCPIGVGMFWYTKNMKKKLVFGGAIALMLVCIILTMSRGGWVGIAMAALIFVLLVDKRVLLFAIPLLLGALIFLPQTVINRILSIGNLADSSTAYRFQIWDITGDVIRDHAVAGVGFGHLPYKQVFETYIRTMPIFHAHNSFIQTIAEIGYAGFMIFISMLFMIIKYPYTKLVKQPKDEKIDLYLKYVGAGFVSGLIGVFTHGMFENVLYLPKIIFTFWTVVAMVICSVNIIEAKRPIKVITEDQQYKIYRRGVEND